jgi:16S rRNA (uracil1498-N3)-methyltransferase
LFFQLLFTCSKSRTCGAKGENVLQYVQAMRLHRFYIENQDYETLKTGDIFSMKEESLVRQITLILRAQIGDSLNLFTDVYEFECVIVSISKKELALQKKKEVKRLLQKREIILVQSLVKKDKFEWIAQKATELGVTDIIPVISERSEKRGLDEKRLRKILIEATEQSGWGKVPTLHPIETLEKTLATLVHSKKDIYVLDMGGVGSVEKGSAPIALCVGPEGGWGEKDKALFKKYNLSILSIGESVLRAETAAIISVYHTTTL